MANITIKIHSVSATAHSFGWKLRWFFETFN